MKIAYVGNFEPEFSTENDYRKAFEHLGHEVLRLQENMDSEKIPPDEELRDIDLLLITSTWDDAISLEVWLDTIHRLAKKGIPTATVHLDTFWPTSRGGRKWWLNAMFHTAFIFTADGDWQKEWKLLGKNHLWLPPGVRHDAVGFGTPRDEYKCDVAFVGSNGVGYHEKEWPYRKELVQKLIEICDKNDWSFKNPGGLLPKIDRNQDLNDFYASAKVVVGDSLCIKKEKAKYWSDRVPETTGRGGLLIMPHIEALEAYGPNVPMYEWGNWDSLERMIKQALDMSDEERMDIKKKHMEEVRIKHTYLERASTILKVINGVN